MIVRRVIATLGLLALALTLGVGPGLTLSRCLITGRVMVACCCASVEVGAAGDRIGEAQSGCCASQTLSAPWQGTQLPQRAAVAAPALVHGFALAGPRLLASARFALPRADGSPPPRRSAAVLRI
ncbi:MAG: hypothetical protein ACYCWW_11430 [Deltaproteobacteria bacterium]